MFDLFCPLQQTEYHSSKASKKVMRRSGIVREKEIIHSFSDNSNRIEKTFFMIFLLFLTSWIVKTSNKSPMRSPERKRNVRFGPEISFFRWRVFSFLRAESDERGDPVEVRGHKWSQKGKVTSNYDQKNLFVGKYFGFVFHSCWFYQVLPGPKHNQRYRERSHSNSTVRQGK